MGGLGGSQWAATETSGAGREDAASCLASSITRAHRESKRTFSQSIVKHDSQQTKETETLEQDSVPEAEEQEEREEREEQEELQLCSGGCPAFLPARRTLEDVLSISEFLAGEQPGRLHPSNCCPVSEVKLLG